MSFDTLVSAALFVGALFLMMRFGCGAHMGHAHGHGGTRSDQAGGPVGSNTGAGGAGPASLDGASSALPGKSAQPQNASEGKAHRHGCC